MDHFTQLIDKLKELEKYVKQLEQENKLLKQCLENKPFPDSKYETKLSHEEYLDFLKLEYDD